MKYFQKTIIASLVVALVSFAGGLCTHPMMAQASSQMEMNMLSQENSVTAGNSCITTSDEVSNTINTCTFDCVTKVPQTTSTKKVVVDTNVQDFIVCPVDDQYIQTSALSLGLMDFSGVHPPSPDILSSVFKRE